MKMCVCGCGEGMLCEWVGGCVIGEGMCGCGGGMCVCGWVCDWWRQCVCVGGCVIGRGNVCVWVGV